MSTKTFKSIFEGRQDGLLQRIDVEHGLLSKLEEYKVITRHHRLAIAVNFVAVAMIVLNTAVLCFVKYNYKEEVTVCTHIDTQITLYM